MPYSTQAMVKFMKIQEIILRAASRQILWTEAAEIIGVSYRTMKRWKQKYQEHGYDGIVDRRMKRPGPKKVPLEEVNKTLTLYRETYMGFNITHFHEKLQDHGIRRGYTFVKNLLQTSGLVAKTLSRGKHRKKRPRRPVVGMTLHLDGSSHEWIPNLPGRYFDLLALMDDANSDVYEMKLVREEDTLSCMEVLKNCIAKQGLFCSLYSDRASHFFYTPNAGKKISKGQLTQIGRALTELGINMIPSYSPQGRGRGERAFGTLQGRLPNEFKLHNIKTLEQANHFLQKTYIKQHNQRFSVKPEQSGSAFVPIESHINLDQIFSIQDYRIVNSDNTVSFQGLTLQIQPSHLRVSFAKCRVKVHLHLDQTISISFGPHILGHYNAKGKTSTRKFAKQKAA